MLKGNSHGFSASHDSRNKTVLQEKHDFKCNRQTTRLTPLKTKTRLSKNYLDETFDYLFLVFAMQFRLVSPRLYLHPPCAFHGRRELLLLALCLLLGFAFSLEIAKVRTGFPSLGPLDTSGYYVRWEGRNCRPFSSLYYAAIIL